MGNNWEEQLNLYGLMFKEAGFEVDKLQVVAILRDWSKFGGQRSQNYPDKQVQAIAIPVWNRDKALAYTKGRVALHKAAESLPDDDIPICTPEERWHKEDAWKVFKGKNKRATRVLKSEMEAENPKAAMEKKTGHDYRIEFFEGEDVRCLHYCACGPKFCNHYKSLVPF